MSNYIIVNGNLYHFDNELYHHGVKGMKWGVRRYQNKDGTLTSAGKKRYDDTEIGELKRKGLTDKQKKALKIGVAVVGTALVAYGAHKVLNDPNIISAGKKAIDSMMNTNGNVKKAITSSTEYKIAKAVGKGVKKYGGKAINVVGSEKVGKFVTGVGTMSVTTSLLRTQLKDLKNVGSGGGDSFDKTMTTIKKTSEIGESINSLAKGPMNQSTSNNKTGNNSNNNGSSNELLKKTRDLKSVVGDPKGISAADEKNYQNLFRRNPTDEQRAIIKAMRKNGYSVEQIESYVFHSDLDIGDLYSILIHSGELYVNRNNDVYLGV